MCESADESYNIAIRYRTIKKRLDNLGYRHTLSLDALPLTEKLLTDLIQTTESLKHFKAIAENNIESCRQSSFSVDPYNYDNTKLVEDCNQLHAQLIEVKDNNLIQTKDLKRKIQRLESDCSDLQLASSRHLKKIKELELESSNKSKRIQELLGKCCKPTISNVGLSSKKRSVYPLRKPVIESEPLPTDNINGGNQFPSLTKVNPQVVDLVAMADRKISSLNHEVIKLKGELSQQTDNVDTLRTQLTMKEKEIIRLKKLHDGGRSYNATIVECSCRKNEPNCGQCNFTSRRTVGNYSQSVCNKMAELSELKVLQQAKLNLEQQLRDALDKQHDAMSQAMKLAERNEELEKELHDIDHVALAVEADCNSTVKQTNKRVSQLQEKLENAMTKVRELEDSLLVEKRMSQELRADLEGCKLEKRNIQRALDSALDEKKHLTNRINELTIIENDLNTEIGRLSKLSETQKPEIVEWELINDTLKEPTHNETPAQSVMNESARLSKDKNPKTNNNVAASNGQRRSVSLSTSNNNNNNNNNSNNIDNNQKLSDNAMNNGFKKMTDESRKLIEQLERDRDHYKDGWNKLNEQMHKSSDTENAELWSQICDLKHQLNEKEARIAELQRDKRDLSRDKFDFGNRVQMTKSHTRNPCSYCNVCPSMSACVCPSAAPTGNGTSSGSKLVLARLERERDAARGEVERLTEERDILHERLKLATEAHTCEQRRLRERLRELETKLNEIETEKQNILIAQGNRQSALSGLEDQLDDTRNELRMTKQELATQRTQYFQLRALQDQTDQALGDVQSQLIQSESELTKALERNKNLDQQQLQLDNQIMELKQEINTLRSNMARLDREKDQLLMSLDEKTERIAALEREVMTKEQQTMGVDHQLRDLQRKNQICMDQSAEQERQLRNMQMEIENYQRQLCAASTDREHAIQENKRMQNDLAAITYDSRTLQRELETARAESQDLKRQLQTYVSEVRRAEELLNKKENERTEMLNHFRSLSLEASVLENNNHSLESEAAEAKGALQSARDRASDLEGQLADKECQIRRYEAQITELTNHVASLETQVRQQMESRCRIESDLNSLRELCVQLDGRKDILQKDVEKTAMMKAQYIDEISKLKLELSAVNNQRNRDHAAVESLEKLLEQETRKSMECHRTNQEMQNEIARLKDRVAELQTKLSAQLAELRSYQNQAAEYNKQIGDLRRQVTDERFNRAKKEEEHRRINQYTGEYSTRLPEYHSGEPASGTSPIVTFDSIYAKQELSHSPFRHPKTSSMAHTESTRLSDIMHEAERTNRFDTGIGSHKDSHTKGSDHTIVYAHGPGTGEPTQSTVAVPGVSGIRVRATVEENENHKAIRLQIAEQPSTSQRPLRGEPVMQGAPATSSNYESRDMFESYTLLENQVNDVDGVANVERDVEEKRDEEKKDQVEHENISEQRTNGKRTRLSNSSVESDEQASVSVIDDSTERSREDKKKAKGKKKGIIEQKEAETQISNEKKEVETQISNEEKQNVAETQISNEKKEVETQISNEKKEVETQIPNEKQREKSETQIPDGEGQKEPCGCDIDTPLLGCIADKQREQHVEFESSDNDNADAHTDKRDIDEGYNTHRLPQSPERTAFINPEKNEPVKHLSLEKLHLPATKAPDHSQSPARDVQIPVIITHPDFSPTQINVEEVEIEMPKAQLSPDINRQIVELEDMAKVIREQMKARDNASSKELADNIEKDDKKHGDMGEKQKDNVHLVSSDLSKFDPPRTSTPGKALTAGKSSEQKSPSKKMNEKSSESINAYIDETTEYSSEDETSEQCQTSKSPPIVDLSHPNDKSQTAANQKDITEKGSSSGSGKERTKIEIIHEDSGSKPKRNKVIYIENDDKPETYNKSPRNCEISKCRRCPLILQNFPTRSSPSSRELVNVETQSSQTEIDAETSYSTADAASLPPRDRRKMKTQLTEKSKPLHAVRPERSNVPELVIQGTAECFTESLSAYKEVKVDDVKSKNKTPTTSAATSRTFTKENHSHSRTRNRTRRPAQSSSVESVAVAACTRDICRDC